MKKWILGGLTVAIIGLAILVIWLKSNDPVLNSQQNSSKFKLSLFHYYSGSLSGGINEMIQTVNQRQGKYVVEAHSLDHEAFKSMIHATLTKGNPPELFTYWAGARVQTLVDRNQLEPLDDLWQEMKLDRRFTKSVIDAASTYSGNKYLLPIDQFVTLFFYHKQFFKDHHLKIPNSWEEFTALSQTLKDKKITPIALGSKERWPAQFWFDYLLLRTAGPEYRDRLMKGNASYTDHEVKNAYRLWSQLLKKKFFNADANALDWAEATELICKGEAAMTLMGTWALQLLESDTCGLTSSGFGYFTFPIINSKVPKVIVGPIDGLVLPKNSTNLQYAKSVLAYFSEDGPQKMLSQGSGAFAPSLSVSKSNYSKFKQRIIKEVEQTPFWAFNYDLATPPAVAELGMNSFKELIEFPGQYEIILQNVQDEAQAIFQQQKDSF